MSRKITWTELYPKKIILAFKWRMYLRRTRGEQGYQSEDHIATQMSDVRGLR